jgi:hypothetical protein
MQTEIMEGNHNCKKSKVEKSLDEIEEETQRSPLSKKNQID